MCDTHTDTYNKIHTQMYTYKQGTHKSQTYRLYACSRENVTVKT